MSSLAPRYRKSHTFPGNAASDEAHVVHIFLDYNCPFSTKLFLNYQDTVIPEVQTKFPNKFEFVFVNVVQPWHPNSQLAHEASLAVANLAPEKFWAYSRALFEAQESFFDTATLNETRNETYKRLADIGTQVGVDADAIYQRVLIAPVAQGAKQSNAGNSVTPEIKYFTRLTRGLGIHVTPTVSIDGNVNAKIESSTPNGDFYKILQSYL
ncbi:hypothetical protein BABINDRAFT_163103 [Babjeviella inositovora NRRL Y-12698]|uniref:Thioredoxin-like fold domain-containing protein n=1 Tax=Babjeviella inositovora NRRL Y-12698 TaxID=984486 RepID=A0A1E3QM64_9ASCO|nr:uncharacterized protein BABINDRAFT_163103 [Babjeviella inositovora NRRL Y-12698]ODQ78077.1 hypothetical protein BABINDRAFT_163103 [Babjeviella inositovora NRRL Y-12698]